MSSETTKALIADLARRGQRGLEFAKQTILMEKIDYPELREALEHYLTGWSDFTHAGLFSLACEGVNGNAQVFTSIQASITIMAAAFDIHDDIIDRSETKHSVPTVYGKYGEEIALLLGNAFWIEGFTLLANSTAQLAPSKTQETLRVLKTNLFDVGNAHASELGFRERENATPSECMQLVEKKAASIEADMSIGAIVGGGTDEQVKALAKYGRIIGILTTLREEFIDIFEIEELVQKVLIKRLPIPILFAMQEAGRKKDIENILAKKEITDNDVKKIVNLVFESKNVKKLKRDMEDLVTKASHLVATLPSLEIGKQLRQWVSSMLEDL
jgi:geranylgeranyl pyrophosphate synthase